ncbi:MAG: hypothetical protein ACXWXO_15155 [Nocardioides sp.]
MVSTPTRHVRGIAAACLSLALAATGVTILTGPAAEAGKGSPGCRLVRLPIPDGYVNGGVMDIEQVGDTVVYYGNSWRRARGGEGPQRAFIWRGLHGEPERVGPRGWDDDTAYELTSSGLINGESTDFETGETIAWVQDIDTMEVTVFDTDSGPRGTDHGAPWIRRINDAGAAAGAVGRDDGTPAEDAVAFASPTSPMTHLSGSEEAITAAGFGINNAGERVGYTGTEWLPGHVDEFLVFDAMKWSADGTRTELVTPDGPDGIPRNIKDDGRASGLMLVGFDIDTFHVEAAYWPTPDVNIGLGVLRGGGYSDAFGMDEGGWLVGAADRAVKPKVNRFGPDGFILHAFLWTPDTTEGRIRILPSLYGRRHDLPWRRWVGSAVHAVNRDLNQVGSSSHWKFKRDRLIDAPTVWLNADQCGVERPTTHDPFNLENGARSASRSRAAVTRFFDETGIDPALSWLDRR